MSNNGATGDSFLQFFEVKELVSDGRMFEEYETSCGDVDTVARCI
jgi:hypothetical protein